jgi:cobyrinic acid a,c-diamide synthase
MISALKHHVCSGRRIYAEGGGFAYLARSMQIGTRLYRGADVLPVVARLRDRPRSPVPVSRTLFRESWLGAAETPVRGYRSGRWSVQVAADPEDCPARTGALTAQHDLVFRNHAIGSMVHLHLGALPEVVRAFTRPHRPSLAVPGTPVAQSRGPSPRRR